MTDNSVARRYAGALFALAQRQGNDALNKNGACLADLAEAISIEPKLAHVLKSPVVSAEEKKAVIGALLEKLGADKIMRNFCFLMADKDRLGYLKEVADWYGILLDQANGILRGTVTTAIKLDSAKQEALREKLRQKAGKDMQLVFSVDPDILGGMVLTVGDKVLDTSLRAQLGILRDILRRGM